MKVLYYYPKTDDMITRHVTILAEGMPPGAEVQTATSYQEFRQRIEAMKPDLVHLHGCWHYPGHKAAAKARKMGIRVVLSPHGQLEPWVLKERTAAGSDQSLPAKIAGKSVFLQRRTTERAYALIAFGKMEEHYLRQVGWNPRIETIRNAVITNSISPGQMCSQTLAVYQKVLDSNTLELMGDDERRLLAGILKAGITGDTRWLSEEAIENTKAVNTEALRRLLVYAEHQNVRNYVDYGISILGLQADAIDTARTAAYFPKKYRRPTPLKQLIGEFKGDETDYLVRMFRQLQKAPLLLHLIELHRELMRDTVDDDSLAEALEEKRMTAFARRILQILAEQTLLDEGYMPLDPLDDRGTQQIRHLIANHLKI